MKEKNTLQKSMDKALNDFKNNDIQKSYESMLSAGMMTCGAIIIDKEKSDSVGTVYGKIQKGNHEYNSNRKYIEVNEGIVKVSYGTERYITTVPHKDGYKVTIGDENYLLVKIKE